MIENIQHYKISKNYTTVSYYLTPIKVAAIIQRQKTSVGRLWRSWNPCAVLMGM